MGVYLICRARIGDRNFRGGGNRNGLVPRQSAYRRNHGKIRPYTDWAGKKFDLYGVVFSGIYNSKQIRYGVGLYGVVLYSVGLYGGGILRKYIA